MGEFVLEPLAASLAVLSAEEREAGVVLVELGAGSTTVAIFQGGKLRHTASLRFAGGHVTSDLVHGLQVTQAEAERIKAAYGSAYEAMVPEVEVIELPGVRGPAGRHAPRKLVAHIMGMRFQEVLELAYDEVTRAGWGMAGLPAGVVLTGGGAGTPGDRGAGPGRLRRAGAGRGAGGRACGAWWIGWLHRDSRFRSGWRSGARGRWRPGPGSARPASRRRRSSGCSGR